VGKTFAGTTSGGIYISNNFGENWQSVNSGLPDNFIFCIEQYDNLLFAGTNKYGIFKSINEGNTWQEINNNFLYTFVESFLIGSNNELYAGTYAGLGIFKTTDFGNTWLKISNGLPDESVDAIVKNSSGTIYCSTWDGIFYSTNNGNSWNHLSSSPQYPRSMFINKTNTIFVGAYGGIYLSTDDGLNWFKSNPPVDPGDVYSFVTNSLGDIWASSKLFGAFYSSDNGASWEQRSEGMKSKQINALLVDSNDFIYAGSADSGIFRSTDNGISWEEVNSGLTNFKINTLATNADNYIFAGTSGGGIFISTNSGSSWRSFNDGLTDIYVYAFAFTDQFVFAGTSEGVFRLSEPISSSKIHNTLPAKLNLSPNYPNPFNSTTKIKFTIPPGDNGSKVRLKIFDILGNEISTQLNEYKPAGEYEVEVNCKDLPSGVYIYYLTVGELSSSNKMILLK